MQRSLRNLKTVKIPFDGGVDESTAAADLPLSDCLEMENYRLSQDGKRVEKRLGLAEEKTDFGVDLYGYITYYDLSSNFCELAVSETEIQRIVGAGSWTSIHTFSGNMVHPVKVIEVQGKQFVINEVDSRMVHHDGNDYQIGIAAPTTLATLTAGSGGSMTAGTYRYAITYARSGNFGCESNPIKSTVGTATLTGSGLDDLTSGGTFTGSSNFTCRVRIDGTGTPDTCEVSYDGGTTYHITDMQLQSTMYLNYGIQLTWAAVTGHTATNYWDIVCAAGAVTVTANQQVTLTSIPTSGDGQVDQRKIYRTLIGGSRFYWLATISNNTTTSFVDNIDDAALGLEMDEDKDVMPDGKFAIWWDNRLWVTGTNILYYSEDGVPEQFDTSSRYINLYQGDSDDEITGMVDYKDALYIFKKNAIYVVMRQPVGGGYGRYLVNKDIGCVAPFSIIEVNNLLMFLSFRGWELYNGFDVYNMKFSLPLKRTLATIDTSNYDFITSVHIRDKSEVLLSIPDATGGAITAVYNYLSGKFYLFSYYKIPSMLVSVRNSSKAIVNKMGTRDGYLCLMESTYRDHTTAITATIRKPWIDAGETVDVTHIETEYELPTNMTLTMNVYVNFDKDVFRTKGLAGATPTSTDIELRRPILGPTELGQRARYFCVEYTNAENLGGDLKINSARMEFRVRADKQREVKGD